MITPNVIKIDKHIPIPAPRTFTGGRPRQSKFHFLKELSVGDSFEVNGNTPGLNPSHVMTACYTVASKLRKLGGNLRDFRVTCRTLEGTSLKPSKVRVWRKS
tara:strand:+ start:169 stop:474 length:306 start_codon:yes stop_codon:yes gene_type:complete